MIFVFSRPTFFYFDPYNNSNTALLQYNTLSKFHIEPTELCPKIKKAHHLYTWQSGLLFTLIAHGSPFLSDRIISWGILLILFLTRWKEKVNNDEIFPQIKIPLDL
jgi:hypothetical protein